MKYIKLLESKIEEPSIKVKIRKIKKETVSDEEIKLKEKRAKQNEYMKIRRADPTIKEIINKQQAAIRNTPEYKEKLKIKYADPQFKEKEKVRGEKRRQHPDHNKKHAEYVKQYRAKPAIKEKLKLERQTEEYKEKMRLYTEARKLVGIKKKRKNLKSDFVKTDVEKNKFIEWLDLHLQYTSNFSSVLHWGEFIENYIKNTSPIIKTIYKEYFQEYIKEKFPDIDNIYKSIRIDKDTTIRGWRHLVINI